MKLTTPRQAFKFLQPCLRSDVEEFWAIALNSEKSVLKAACLFRGTVDLCLFHPRDIFRFAYQHNASALLVAHNHPSGSPKASREDKVVTRQLLAAARILQMPIVDHLILAGDLYFSFLEAGLLPTHPRGPVSPADQSLD